MDERNPSQLRYDMQKLAKDMDKAHTRKTSLERRRQRLNKEIADKDKEIGRIEDEYRRLNELATISECRPQTTILNMQSEVLAKRERARRDDITVAVSLLRNLRGRLFLCSGACP